MEQHNTRFFFSSKVALAEVEATLRLARLATESLHGFDRVQLDTSSHLDASQRCVSIDVARKPGHTLALIFMGFARREFGAQELQVQPANGLTSSE